MDASSRPFLADHQGRGKEHLRDILACGVCWSWHKLRAGIPKRISPQTFRHTFASHLLLANYDLQTIQRLPGHSDIKTTMIYLQTVPSLTLKEAWSPLDLGPADTAGGGKRRRGRAAHSNSLLGGSLQVIS